MCGDWYQQTAVCVVTGISKLQFVLASAVVCSCLKTDHRTLGCDRGLHTVGLCTVGLHTVGLCTVGLCTIRLHTVGQSL